MKKYLFLLCGLILSACGSSQRDYASFVDPGIGSGGHGHVFVGANVPFGMVQLGPTSVPVSWDWCSGYHESDSSVIGFSHTHLSGTGIGDLFDVTVLPVTSLPVDWTRSGQADKALREKEIKEPGYYSVPLERSGILCEMTATARVGFHRYAFPEDGSLVFDLENGGCWDELTDAAIEVLDSMHIAGYRHSKGWADDQKLWFAAEFSSPFSSVEEVADNHWKFDFPGRKTVMVKVALSPVSSDKALGNIAAEIPGWNFDAVRNGARDAWNAELGKVEVETEDTVARKVFYTALYHTMMEPVLYSDAGDPDRYTVFSLWDTYRAQMPLFTILHPEKEDDVINTFLDIYDRQGDLPVWHLWGCETDCMIGNPGIPVVADAILKGFDGFDVGKAYEAMKATALTPDRGQDLRMKYGYIPCDLFTESVAYDMEYALADWSLAQVAGKLGNAEDHDLFMERSRSYAKHFDPRTRFMRGVDTGGRFREPFNPFRSEHRADDYAEGNAWQYTWLVPHDIEGLEACFGGKDAFLDKLDSLFTVSSELQGDNASADISGLIGQYAHGNEPSHHILYFYTMAGQPWKTADLVRKVCNELYSASSDGLSGNEDAGQMSAWYILSSIGFYQVEPAGGRYWFGAPMFDKVSIDLPGGKKFVVRATGLSDTNRYIEDVRLNGVPYTENYIMYSDIMSGGELEFIMGEGHGGQDMSQWMSDLPDDLPACRMSIPGAHDACTAGVDDEYSYYRTQVLDIQGLWDAGVRSFDLRPCARESGIGIFHDKADTHVSFEGAVSTLISNIDRHPGEFAVVIFRHEKEADVSGDWEKMMGDYLNSEALVGYVIDFRDDLTLGELRGHILFLARQKYDNGPVGAYLEDWDDVADLANDNPAKAVNASGKTFTVQVQDVYGPEGKDEKLQAVKALLDNTGSDGVWTVNHTSAYVSSTFSYGENASNVNSDVADLVEAKSGPAGIIVMDFAGVDEYVGPYVVDGKNGSVKWNVSGRKLVRALVEHNFK